MDTSVAAADTTSEPQYGPSAKRMKLEGKPIGIAQPFRQQEQATDSDQDSIDTRFDRFQNESNVKKPGSQPSPHPSLTPSDTLSSTSVQQPETPSQGSDATGLLGGKQWMVFISHSTSDTILIKTELVYPLRDLKIPVTACYQYMPDSSRYDDNAIQKSMADSCLIIIALSNAYTRSPRCVKEWQHAVYLRKKAQCRIVVVSIQICSRPPPLKEFLYLDFVDPVKKNLVWDMLMEKIEQCMMLPPSPPNAVKKPPESHQQHDSKAITQHPLQSEENSPDPASSVSCDIDHSDGVPNDFDALYNNENLIEPKQLEDAVSSIESTTEAALEQIINEEGYTSEESTEQTREHHLPVELDPKNVEPDTIHSDISNKAIPADQSQETESLPKAQDCLPEGGGLTNEDIFEDDQIEEQDVEEGEVSESDSEKLDHLDQGSKGTSFYNQLAIPDADRREESPIYLMRTSDSEEPDQASKVTSFYNQLAMPDADRREESPIYFMRNFNNWVKSVLIRTTLHKRQGAVVLDLCCGKGGDLLKWKEARISYLVCADISDVSIEACRDRYNSHKMSVRGKPPFDAEFICEDCCEVRLRERYSNPGRRFNLTSCQFSVHYSFESFEKAHMMLRNACENIVPGGYFIGTTVDSNQIIYRLRETEPNEDGVWSFGNDVFTVTLDPSLDPKSTLPLFGAKYNFKLHGVVDLPEYLIHFPTFQAMLEDFDMEFVHRQNFTEFFDERRYKPEDADLLYRMNAFSRRTGTMSASEWEAIGLYMVYKFRKRYPKIPEHTH